MYDVPVMLAILVYSLSDGDFLYILYPATPNSFSIAQESEFFQPSPMIVNSGLDSLHDS